MKQYTTKKQWNELSNKGQERFLDWLYRGGEERLGVKSDNGDYRILSIGQMIEFLGDGERPDEYASIIEMLKALNYDSTRSLSFRDALWEAVKEKLNN